MILNLHLLWKTFQQVFVNVINIRQLNINGILGVSILSLDNSSDIDYINHSRTPLDPRDYARFGLRAAFIPNLSNVPSYDKRMMNLEAFAIKVEADIFASTESQRTYLDSVTKKISDITKYIQNQGTNIVNW